MKSRRTTLPTIMGNMRSLKNKMNLLQVLFLTPEKDWEKIIHCEGKVKLRENKDSSMKKLNYFKQNETRDVGLGMKKISSLQRSRTDSRQKRVNEPNVHIITVTPCGPLLMTTSSTTVHRLWGTSLPSCLVSYSMFLIPLALVRDSTEPIENTHLFLMPKKIKAVRLTLFTAYRDVMYHWGVSFVDYLLKWLTLKCMIDCLFFIIIFLCP